MLGLYTLYLAPWKRVKKSWINKLASFGNSNFYPFGQTDYEAIRVTSLVHFEIWCGFEVNNWNLVINIILTSILSQIFKGKPALERKLCFTQKTNLRPTELKYNLRVILGICRLAAIFFVVEQSEKTKYWPDYLHQNKVN